MDVIRCQTCEEVFDGRSALNNHVRKVHQSSVSVTLRSGSTLRIKRGPDGRFKCICGTSLLHSHSVHRHARSCGGDMLTSEPENTPREDGRAEQATGPDRDERAAVAAEDEVDDADDVRDVSYDLVGTSRS